MNVGIQRKTDLAFRILRQLGATGQKLSGVELSAAVGTSTSFLPQVVAPLVDHGWVTSERGPGGGYALTDSSVDVTLLDVLEATQGPTANGRCVLRDQPCPGDHDCEVHTVWIAAREVLVEGLKHIPASHSGERK